MIEKPVDEFQGNGISRLLKASEVATILNISRSFAYQLLETGQLPTIRIRRALRVRVQDLEDYIKANRYTKDNQVNSH